MTIEQLVLHLWFTMISDLWQIPYYQGVDVHEYHEIHSLTDVSHSKDQRSRERGAGADTNRIRRSKSQHTIKHPWDCHQIIYIMCRFKKHAQWLIYIHKLIAKFTDRCKGFECENGGTVQIHGGQCVCVCPGNYVGFNCQYKGLSICAKVVWCKLKFVCVWFSFFLNSQHLHQW